MTAMFLSGEGACVPTGGAGKCHVTERVAWRVLRQLPPPPSSFVMAPGVVSRETKTR